MSSNVASHLPTQSGNSGWSATEFTELQRTIKRLTDAGFIVEAGWGVTDEGDPWFVFINECDGDLILHLMRLNNSYTAIAPALSGSLHALDLQTLAIETVQRLTKPSHYISSQSPQD
ncbi:hypothetical protein [Pseudochelatococcus sp. G4_1912]|uniref:hypothetical protein n=1 Tax=Pseudochelatococcus sp. G4_1912 TaxID=3114288 RepID=UPI0039C61DB4